MKFSLVLTTINRTKELIRLLDTLIGQTYKNFELIIVDQNEDNRLDDIISAYKHKLNLTHLNSKKGLSKGRNIGLNMVKGDIIAFPDDDCWYPNDLLQKIVDFFNNNESIDGLTGVCTDENLNKVAARFDKEAGLINKKNVWSRGISVTLFVRSKIVFEKGIYFDETLGAGSGTVWGSGEETDFLLRALNKDCKLFYTPEIIVHHPNPLLTYSSEINKKAYSYGAGMGKVLKKHSYPLSFLLYYLFRPVLGSLLYILKGNFGKSNYYWFVFKGRIRGWIS